jgi:cell wall-associated NlpC family hydrolase
MQRLRPLTLLLALSLLATACSTTQKSGSSAKNAPSSAASMQLRKRVVDKARQQVGAAYKYAGTSPSSGFDCSGFTFFVFKSFDVEVSPSSAEQSKQGYKVPLDRVKPADLVFFGDEKRIQHVAMVVERTKDGIVCVHSTTSRGVIVENVSNSSYWKPKILFARDVLSR